MWLASAAISIRSTNPGFSLGWNVDCTHHARSTFATMTCSDRARWPAARRLSWFSRGAMAVTSPVSSSCI